jgi:uncharacterized protein YjdB
MTLGVNVSDSFTATFIPDNATNQNVYWTSSDPSIAVISSTGVVTALQPGAVTINAVSQGLNNPSRNPYITANGIVNDSGNSIFPAPLTVTVPQSAVSATGVTLDKNTLALTVGNFETLTPTVQPSNATNQAVNWISSDTSIAVVSSHGVVTALAPGMAVVTVATRDGGNMASCTVTVNPATTTVPVTGVSLNKNTMTLTVGGTEQLTHTIQPSNATNQNVTWETSNSAAATVANGLVTAIAQGSATITVRTADGNHTATCAVTVNPATVPVTGVSLNKNTMTLSVGGTEQLTHTIQPSNATNQNVTWESSNNAAATVANGLVTAIAQGSATITVRTVDGNHTATCAVTVVGSSTVTPDTSWYYNNPTATTFTIYDADQLAGLATLVNNGIDSFSGKTIILGNNIDLSAYASGEGWTPVGIYPYFTGTFDGNGKTISNLTINRTSDNYSTVGLFGYVGGYASGGTVQNLGIVNASINGGSYVGGIAGSVGSNSSITNCYSTGVISGSSSYGYVGGIAGFVDNSSITDCYSTAAVSGSGNVGGIAGFVWPSSSITDCYSTGAVSGNGDSVGGIAGHVGDNSSITNCHSTGAVSGNGDRVGGIAGDVRDSSITNCYSTGAVSGSSRVGGIAGEVYNNSTITNCYSKGVISDSGGDHTTIVGGIAGFVTSNSSITNCYSTGAVSGSGSNPVGGIAGWVTNSSITNCYSTGSVSGTSSVGGIAGLVNNNSNITNCYSTGAVSGNIYVGGVTGQAYDSSITGCAALNVSVTTSGSYTIGRIICSVSNNTLSNNIAWSGMLVNGSTVSGTANDKNGANKTGAEIHNGSAFNGMFTDGVWTKQTGWLPGLFGQLVPIPEHIVNPATTTVPVTGVSLNKNTMTLTVGGTEQLTHTIQPSNATNQSVTWETSNSAVATTVANGLVTAIAPGSATITVRTVDGNYTATCVVTVVGSSTGTPDTSWYYNNPTATTFTIYNADQLAGLATLVNNGTDSFSGKTIILGNNIDLSAYAGGDGWMPIGGNNNRYFSGVFNGNGKTISNLTINRTSDNYNYIGLFGFVSNGTVQNLGIVNASISSGISYYVGGIAGFVGNSSITNCYSTATVSSSGEYVGGIAGGVSNNSSITNCYSTGAISRSSSYGGSVGGIGGIAGSVQTNSSITNCYSTGAISSSGVGSVGGIAGSVQTNSSITNCYSTAVSGSGYYVGGIAGSVQTNSSITNCYSTGAVSGYNCVGGIAGMLDGSSITNCAALNVSVTSSDNSIGRVADYVSESTLSSNIAWSGMLVNGIIISDAANDKNGTGKTAAEIQSGSAFNGMFTDSVWTKQAGYLPGLFGQLAPIPAHIVDTPHTPGTPDTSWYNSAATTLTLYNADQLAGLATLVNNGIDNFWDKTIILGNNIDLSAYAGGEGWMPIGTSSRQFSGVFDGNGKTISNLTINRTSDYYIGLFGTVGGIYGKIQNLGVVNASISGGSYVGGIAGSVHGSSITNCYSTGAVSGSSNNVGGIAGRVYGDVYGSSSITNCYSTGAISSNYGSVGGIAGMLDGSSITNCYSTGAVGGSNDVGGIAGRVSNSSITNCYSTGAVSGNNFVGGIAGYVSGSSITSCAALNASVTVTSSGGNIGRVATSYVSDYVSESTLSNNIAWSGMLVNGVTVSGAANDKNGANKTGAEIHNGSAFNGMFTDSVWTKQAGYLPGLFGQLAPIPPHIANAPAVAPPAPDTSWYNSAATTFTLNTAEQLAGLAELVNSGADSFSGKTIILGNNIDLFAYTGGEGWTPIGDYNGYRPFSGAFNGGYKTISNLTINRADDYIGLFGYVSYGKIQNLGVVNASISGGNYIGGVAGYVYGADVMNCYSTGVISGTGNFVGGIAGYIYDSSAENCYSTGAISGNTYVGGVAGHVANSGITSCAALNVSLTGSGDSKHIGRVAGYADIESTLSNNIAWSGMLVNGVTVSGTANDRNGANKTATEIHNGNAFNGMFTDGVWNKKPGWLPGLFGQAVPIPAHIN